MVLVPVAAATLIWVQVGENTLGGHGTTHTVMLLAAGVITAIPLWSLRRRRPARALGDHWAPPVHDPDPATALRVLLLGEHVSPALWIGFGIVWIALALLTFDSMQHSRHNRARTDLIDPEP